METSSPQTEMFPDPTPRPTPQRGAKVAAKEPVTPIRAAKRTKRAKPARKYASKAKAKTAEAPAQPVKRARKARKARKRPSVAKPLPPPSRVAKAKTSATKRNWDYDFTEAEVIRAFALNLREARIEAGLTQEQLSMAINYSRIAVCNMERGANGATLATLLRLCSVLKCSPDVLLRKRSV